MPTVPATRRLSPRVRVLLQQHGLHARSIAGTGTDGRVTPSDVLRAAGVPRKDPDSGVLASPLARRLLRELDVDLMDAAVANDGRPVRRADAQRVIDEGAVAGAGTHPGPSGTSTSEVEVDVARLVASVAAANRDFVVRHGFELSTAVALASAAAAVLVRRPGLEVAAALPASGDGRAYPPVHVGFHHDGGRGSVAVVPDVQDLTVAGLARRARASAVAGEAPGPATTDPTVVVSTDGTAPGESSPGAEIGLLRISSPVAADGTGADRGDSRAHARVRLDHDDRTSPAAAGEFLDELAAILTSWSLPVGP